MITAVALTVALASPQDSLVDYVTDQCDAATVDVRWFGVAPTAIPEGTELLWSGDPCRSRPDLTLTVIQDHVQVSRMKVQPGLSILVNGWILAEPVDRGEVVTLKAGPVPLGTRHVGQGTWRARRALPVGKPVSALDVEALPDGTAGTPVSIIAKHGSLMISTPGRLLTDGRLGEEVRVRIDATRVVSTGILTQPTEVEVR